MQSVRLDDNRRLKLYQESTLPVQTGEVRLRINAVGICGSDLHRFRDVTFAGENNKGLVLGHEFSATILEIGKNVDDLQPGDRVAVEPGIHCGACEWCGKGQYNLCVNIKFCGVPPHDGALRDELVWPAHLVYKLLPHMSHDDGVMLEPLAICLHAIDLAHIKPGYTATVLGAGPIGLGTIHLLKQTSGCHTVIASEIIKERLSMAERMGADTLLDAKYTDVVAAVMDQTQGRGVDVVFEAAGQPDTFEQAVEICAPGGRVLLIGIPEDNRIPFSAASARRKGLSLLLVRRSLLTVPRCMQLMNSGLINVRPLVTHHFPLQKAQQAFEWVDRYKDGVIKAVINP
ncbi:MAG: alcohol dehydrogenase catalytic domain-containing protein [candidate division KSB1 bacterium]|nr:alcohol dehydrogenase catalytic domain-containing protein [candidate division KSB1 bacterium]